MKIAKVITTSFVPRVPRNKSSICGEPPGYFSHSLNFVTNESIIQLIQLNINLEEQCDPGVDVDLIVVNNDSGFQPGVDYLNGLDGKKLKKGIVRVFHRENYGRSFGGYNYAFIKLREDYDYFIFTEDDIVIWQDGYAREGLNVLNKNPSCGFVAYQGVTKKFNDRSVEDAIHVHGGVGMASTKVLNAVVERCGCLPHAGFSETQKYENIIEKGEVAFTNEIYKLGFQICELDHSLKMYDFAYDLMRGIDLPRYLNVSELLKFNCLMILKKTYTKCKYYLLTWF
jgi:hypothetical protein